MRSSSIVKGRVSLAIVLLQSWAEQCGDEATLVLYVLNNVFIAHVYCDGNVIGGGCGLFNVAFV